MYIYIVDWDLKSIFNQYKSSLSLPRLFQYLRFRANFWDRVKRSVFLSPRTHTTRFCCVLFAMSMWCFFSFWQLNSYSNSCWAPEGVLIFLYLSFSPNFVSRIAHALHLRIAHAPHSRLTPMLRITHVCFLLLRNYSGRCLFLLWILFITHYDCSI